jgi:hypothetical protein
MQREDMSAFVCFYLHTYSSSKVLYPLQGLFRNQTQLLKENCLVSLFPREAVRFQTITQGYESNMVV